MKPSLFIHFGPGGHCELEKQWLAPNLTQWLDLSSSNDSFATFADFTHFYQKHMSQQTATPWTVYAHSFGADVAFHLMQSFPNLIGELHLISPLWDLKRAIIQLSKRLQHGFNKTPDNTVRPYAYTDEEFWQHVQMSSQHPDYFMSLWKSPQAWNTFQSLANKLPPIRTDLWAKFIMANYQQPIPWSTLENREKVKVYLGDHDPYLTPLDWQLWINLLSPSQVITVASGHFPHLEKPEIGGWSSAQKPH